MIISRRRSGYVGCLLAALGALAGCVSTSPTAASSVATTTAAATAPASESASSSASASGSASASAAACTTGGLDVGITEASGGAAAGSNYLLVEFTNTGAAPCTLYGWPGVSLVGDGNGTQLGAAAVRVQSGDRHTVTLQPGKKTTALLRVVEAGNYSTGACDPATADGFRIYVPDQKTAVYVKRSTPACRKDGPKLLQIAPVGTSG